MHNKKAMELPISMIVMLIISIIVFIFGISLVYKISRAGDVAQQIDQRVQDEIMSALRQGNEIVAMPKNYAKAKPGQKISFAIGIRNIDSDAEFSVVLGLDNAYTPDDAGIIPVDNFYIEDNWLGNFKEQKTGIIKKDQYKIMPITIKAGPNIRDTESAKKGTYVFNVCVFKGTPIECVAGNLASTYPQNKIQQINVQI